MAKKLSLVGYLNVKVLEGGWFEWLDLSYPTVSKAEEDANGSG
jgi:3-mercaptopyruvate sulfurtransferase SseA